MEEFELMTEVETAALLKLKPNTLRRWRYAGRGPSFRRLGGGAIRYERGAVRRWIDDQELVSPVSPSPVAS